MLRYLQSAEIFRQRSEHIEEQNTVVPDTSKEHVYAAVQPFTLLRQCPRDALSPLNDYVPTAFDYNKGGAVLIELLLGEPVNL